ncbi:MAG: FAD-dependent oxidoreductase [Halopseudomonas sp.]|uniref:NAD(P)/FAD-dependent oxidoreductase n=1 Tax=Halopseudomonas sp. TaxID=2901191 RepID=UPI0030030670
MNQPPSVAIIGAGMSGLSAASLLRETGLNVTLFDKSRGSGGRMSSKRTSAGTFDMGTQYFTARDSAFSATVDAWLAAGWVAVWQPRLFRYDEHGLHPSSDDQRRLVGNPRMTALSRALLADTPLHSSTRIEQLQRDRQQWRLVDTEGESHGPFDQIIVAVPPAQAAPLLRAIGSLSGPAERTSMDPGWAVALGFAQPLNVPFDAVFVRSGPLDWIAREASKPGREATQNWVLQSTPAWAAGHLDDSPEQVIQELTQALAEVLGQRLPDLSFQQAHRWLYARPNETSDWGALAAPDQGLFVCGDWCVGGRLEGAWLSGQQAAKALLERL